MCLCWFLQGKFEEEIELYKKAIVIGEQTLGKDHPDVATRYNNLAGVYKAQACSCDNPRLCPSVRGRLVGISNPRSISNT